MEKQKKTYSQEFKLKALELIEQRGNLSEIARELSISKYTLINWQRLKSKEKSKVTITSINLKSKEELEIIALKKALYESNLERDILKKAVSIFSKSDR